MILCVLSTSGMNHPRPSNAHLELRNRSSW
jgi:hypothetical protein